MTKLSLVNKNGLGCLTYEPNQPFEYEYGDFNLDELSKEIEKIINDETLNCYALSPAYYLTRVTDKFEHEMTINGNGNPTKDDLLSAAKEFRLTATKCKTIMNGIEKTCKNV